MRLVPGRSSGLADFIRAPGFCDEELIFFRVSDLLRRRRRTRPNKPDEDEDIFVQSRSTGSSSAAILSTWLGLTRDIVWT